jgi:hypothetical protein
VANNFFRRRTLVLLALIVIAIIAGKVGPIHVPTHLVPGFWDGPA